MIKNAYVHIPFCRSKCHYCSFVSFCDLSAKKAYLDALKLQIKAEYLRSCDGGVVTPPYVDSDNKGEKLNTLYFGGGTPSLLPIEEFKSLIDLFEFESDAEITVEVNPDSVDFEYLCELRNLGVNRLSIGVQTFDDETLKLIGRRHNSAQAKLAVESAKKAKFENISVDLIYGLPNQSIRAFEKDLQTAIDLSVQHISLYGLKIESESYFGKNMPQNLPDLDLQADMYLKAIEFLISNGFVHYEVSNFAKKGFESRHNLNYWENNTYYGFGCAASGYVKKKLTPALSPRTTFPLTSILSPSGEEEQQKGILIWQGRVRYQNESDLKKYIQNPLSKISQEKLSQQNVLEEAIFLGLRKIAGINIQKINKQFGIDFDKKYAKILEKYLKFFRKTECGWALNIDGILISNDILAEFIE